jgi:hypothetical protein
MPVALLGGSELDAEEDSKPDAKNGNRVLRAFSPGSIAS